LVLLRLVIGWHFLFEGIEKLTSDSWSSEAYLREASGPLSPMFHGIVGDKLVEELTPLPESAGSESHTRMPPTLAKEWDGYFQRFVDHYGLKDEQRSKADAILLRHKDKVTSWILSGTKKVTRTSPYGPPIEVERSTPERLKEYQ